MTRRDALVTRNDFEMCIVHMDDALAEFCEWLPQAVRERSTISPQSLDALEAWLLKQYPRPEALMARSESRVLDGGARYIGEAFRMTVGGRWTIDLENRKTRISVCRC
jgi:hypothetical protein